MAKKKGSSTSKGAELGTFVLVDKQGLTKLLHDYKKNVKSKEEIVPFIDRYHEQMRRLNMGLK